MLAETQAEYSYKQWAADPAVAHAFLVAQVNNPATAFSESDWLDYKVGYHLWFKNGNPVTPQERRNEIMSQMGKYISAFSNVSGGLLIWGIKCGQRIPDAISYTQDVNEHVAECEKQLRTVVDPPVPGVKFLALPNPANPPEGLVVMYVPKSEYLPHQSKMEPRTFWMRTSDSCDPIPTGMLRTMFYPKVAPRCRLIATATITKAAGGDNIAASIDITVCNDGNASAEHPVLRIVSAQIMGVGNLRCQAASAAWQFINQGLTIRSDHILHPGESQSVGLLATPLAYHPDILFGKNMSFEITIYARDAEPVTWSGSLPASELDRYKNTANRKAVLSLEVMRVEV